MPYNNPEEIRQIVKRAKAEEKDAQQAEEVVNDAISHLIPQRHYNQDKSQNKR